VNARVGECPVVAVCPPPIGECAVVAGCPPAGECVVVAVWLPPGVCPLGVCPPEWCAGAACDAGLFGADLCAGSDFCGDRPAEATAVTPRTTINMKHLCTMRFLRLIEFIAAPVQIRTSSSQTHQEEISFVRPEVDQIGRSGESLGSRVLIGSRAHACQRGSVCKLV